MTIDGASFGKVGVLLGGLSAEHDISLMSGNGVLDALRSRGVDAHPFDIAERPLSELAAERFDRVFIALHGRFGEDGAIQGVLEILGIPYTGSGVMACAVAMDKIFTKRVWKSEGLPTPNHALLDASTDLMQIPDRLGLPMIVKPPHEGSTLGITKVATYADLVAGYELAARFDDVVLAEEFIAGRELTIAIVERPDGRREALPIIEIVAPAGNYDYQNKYFTDDTRYLCPAPLSDAITLRVQRLALEAFEAIGCEGWGRVDLMLRHADDEPFLLEVNASPGMTGTRWCRWRHARSACRTPTSASRSSRAGAARRGGPASPMRPSPTGRAPMWDSPRLLNLLALAIAMVAAAAFVAGAAAWASRRPVFALKTIRVEPLVVADVAADAQAPALRHVSATTIRASAFKDIRAATGGSFFTVDLEAVRRAFETVPWVRRAQVRREWPDRLVVRLEEHRVLGTWDDGRLVNTFGELFTANPAEAEEDVPHLPDLAGPAGSERDVASRYVDFRSWFARLSLVPDQVTLSPRYAWSVHFDNGTDDGLTVDLGRERDGSTVPERVLRMINAWPALVTRWARPTLIDLRYPNGFALRAEGLRIADENQKTPAKPVVRPAASRTTTGKPATKNRAAPPATKAKT